MMVRRYVVKDMPEAVTRIRQDLGRDAVILSTKRVTVKKWLGFWRSKRIEVVAAIGDDVPLRATAQQVQRLMQSVPDFRARPQDERMSPPAEHGGSRHAEAVEAHLEPLYRRLLWHGMSEEGARRLLEVMRARQGNRPESDAADMLAGLAEPQPISPQSRLVAFVGPTGVGKTTTVAKLAALHVLSGERKVGLITTDTYRIAAVEQLRTYADILGVPLAVVYRPEDLPSALAQMDDRDLIFIDTAGRNYHLDAYIREAEAWLRAVPIDETFLVLAATGKPQDLDAVARKFAALPVDKFVFTKMDETATYGAILDLVLNHRKPVSYITTGQNVPDDIEVASFEKILKLILEGAA
ncbi:flagellar biosynthesis protein FlhF [Alicyclobacillus cellulosilyticus]|uniref:Flagellar biosynthesis protein FlhF n=1 Tax=Alicyclobacillus cellulosilyticus TaxID=1003997 RepID=A0A917NEJ0_9BACL|nr:flagellar biosynthesis protein FlhF [Alicyclobacillus cellulosilyticus]GGI94612.1 flagellar biosynthesis protein FlhF [Alicyclobacillus cellulosilyticus]